MFEEDKLTDDQLEQVTGDTVRVGDCDPKPAKKPVTLFPCRLQLGDNRGSSG